MILRILNTHEKISLNSTSGVIVIPDNDFKEWLDNDTLIDHMDDIQPIIDTDNSLCYSKHFKNNDRSSAYIKVEQL